MQAFLKQWQSIGVEFSALVTGYLKSSQQIASLIDFLEHENLPLIVDPIMGDNGELYKGFDDHYISSMRTLCQKADLIFYNGINLENGEDAWFAKMVKNAKKEANKDYFAVSDGVQVIYLEGQNEAGKEDPHAWLNIENGIIYAKNIAKQLIAKDPKNKEAYEKNLATYVEKLEALDKDAKARIAKIPEEKRLIVTSEGCFKYFSKAYDIPSAYIWEINTEEEGTPEQITKLVRQLRESKVPSLFVESSVDDRPMKTVSQETGKPIHSTIFTDSIAEEGKDGDSYYSMMKWNLDKIIEGLSK